MTLPDRPSRLRWALARISARISARIALLAFALAAGPAFAETWVDVAPSAAAMAMLQFDADSVAPAGTSRVAVTWRTGTSPGRPYFLKRGMVDCAGESLQIATSTYVATDPGRGKYGAAVTDFAAGMRTWQGRTTRLTGAERAEGSEFPAAGDPAGRLIGLVCTEPGRMQTALGADATALQNELGCSTASTAASRGCAGDPATLATLRLLALRLGQAQQACALSAAQTSRLRASTLVRTSDCAPSSTVCSVSPLQAALTGLGSDLSRAAAGQACAYVPEALDRVADDAAQRAATARFQACVTRTVAALDDRVSQADVVAQGVFGACRGELPAEIAQGRPFANGLMPGLTAEVLKHRRGAAKISSTSKPLHTD